MDSDGKKEIPKWYYDKLEELGMLPDISTRYANEGKSDYSTHFIQPWSIWLDYPKLTSFDHDIIKRVLREKDEAGMTYEDARIMDYRKIIHIAQERIRQLVVQKARKDLDAQHEQWQKQVLNDLDNAGE